jgi:hypothetical protein
MLTPYNSNALKLLRLICFIIYHFSSLGNLKVLYIAIIQQKFSTCLSPGITVVWQIPINGKTYKGSLQSYATTSQILKTIMNKFQIMLFQMITS